MKLFVAFANYVKPEFWQILRKMQEMREHLVQMEMEVQEFRNRRQLPKGLDLRERVELLEMDLYDLRKEKKRVELLMLVSGMENLRLLQPLKQQDLEVLRNRLAQARRLKRRSWWEFLDLLTRQVLQVLDELLQIIQQLNQLNYQYQPLQEHHESYRKGLIAKLLPEEFLAELETMCNEMHQSGQPKTWITLRRWITKLELLKAHVQIKMENSDFFKMISHRKD